MNFLRIKIYQPQAHYRIPFTYRIRHTYPLPPYSTVIGLFCNVLGIDSQLSDDYKKLKKIKLSIAGRFESKTTEYVWFRNLSSKSHIGRFGYVENRSINGHIEHIGGQTPVLIDVLNEVHLIIYVAYEEAPHEKENFLEKLKGALENPAKRLEIIHLGRAEDWIVLEEVSDLLDISTFEVQSRDGNFGHFFWIPKKIWAEKSDGKALNIFNSVDGLLYRVPSFWTIEGYEKTFNRHGIRNFDFILAKLNDGLLTNQTFLFDIHTRLPIFFADFNKGVK